MIDVIKKLEEENNLDRDALSKYRFKKFIVNAIIIFCYCLGLYIVYAGYTDNTIEKDGKILTTVILLFLLYGTYSCFFKGRAFMKKVILLYNFGTLIEGRIESVKFKSRSFGTPERTIIKYSYSVDDKDYSFTEIYISAYVAGDNDINEGDEITILYYSENPEISTVLLARHYKIYNLTKENKPWQTTL